VGLKGWTKWKMSLLLLIYFWNPVRLRHVSPRSTWAPSIHPAGGWAEHTSCWTWAVVALELKMPCTTCWIN
jgi:hypothetical protein